MVNLKESIISEIKDLAIVGGNAALFAVEAEEEIQTLLMFDIVDLGGFVQDGLRQSIEREGKIIYEKI